MFLELVWSVITSQGLDALRIDKDDDDRQRTPRRPVNYTRSFLPLEDTVIQTTTVFFIISLSQDSTLRTLRTLCPQYTSLNNSSRLSKRMKPRSATLPLHPNAHILKLLRIFLQMLHEPALSGYHRCSSRLGRKPLGSVTDAIQHACCSDLVGLGIRWRQRW